jgi:DNA-binding NarL/FixJ family response regulator
MATPQSIVRAGMTPRQQAVCEGLIEGLSNREIAVRSRTSERNVKAVCARLFRSFGITSGIKRIHLARELLRLGWR